jgi:hypothetical protein
VSCRGGRGAQTSGRAMVEGVEEEAYTRECRVAFRSQCHQGHHLREAQARRLKPIVVALGDHTRRLAYVETTTGAEHLGPTLRASGLACCVRSRVGRGHRALYTLISLDNSIILNIVVSTCATISCNVYTCLIRCYSLCITYNERSCRQRQRNAVTLRRTRTPLYVKRLLALLANSQCRLRTSYDGPSYDVLG